jgi:putative ABC transport system permease protein
MGMTLRRGASTMVLLAWLRSRWWEAVLKAVVAAIGITLAGAGGLAALSQSSSLAAAKARLNAPDLWVETLAADAATLYARTQSIGTVSQVTPLYWRQHGVLRLSTKTLAVDVSPLPEHPPPVGHLTIIAGAWPAAGEPGALIERGAGQWFSATTVTGRVSELSGSGGQLAVPITGIVADLSVATYPLGTPARLYVSPAVWQRIGGDRSATTALFGLRLLDRSRALPTALAIRALLPSGHPLSVQGLNAVEGALQPITLALEAFLLLFGLVGMAACLAFAAGITRASIIRRVREIGILRATGWSLTAIRRVLVAEAVGSSLAGALIGCGGAAALAAWLTGRIVQSMGAEPHLSGTPVLGGLVIILALAVAAAALAATRGLGRSSPATVLAAGYRLPPSGLSRPLSRKRLGVTRQLALALVAGRPGRAITAMIVLAAGMTAVLFSVITSQTIATFASDPASWGYAYDWRLDTLPSVTPAEVTRTLADSRQVQNFTAVYEDPAQLSSAPTTARFVSAQQRLLVFHLLRGHPIQAPDQVLIGAGLASATGLAPGNRVGLTVGDARVPVTIAGTYRELDNGGQVLIGGLALLHTLKPEAAPSYYLVKLPAGADQAAARRSIEQSLGDRVVITTISDQLAMPITGVFQAVLLTLGSGLAILAAIVMLNLTVILVEEQLPVVGIVRAIGAGWGQVVSAFAWAAALLLVPALLIGIPAGILVTVALISSLSGTIGGVDASLSPGLLALGLAGATLVALLGFALPLPVAARADPAAMLRSER